MNYRETGYSISDMWCTHKCNHTKSHKKAIRQPSLSNTFRYLRQSNSNNLFIFILRDESESKCMHKHFREKLASLSLLEEILLKAVLT